ncbi:SDR family oxidoreductase [Streptomyces sp. NPDC006251]|uniref:SDR family oxidoreductase n=1 Tax=Streptomyces sp. NPDC006251 TaxID=3155718 RepID=UPI0033A018F5
MQDLKGKVALVTGGARNVGKGISKALASRGAHVIINYFHSAEAARQTKAELERAGGQVTLIRASVARQEQVDRMFAEIDERFGYLDILVNNAASGALVPVGEVTDEHLDKAIDTNYKGSLRVSRAAAPLMARRGGGSIVTVSALGGSQMVMANYLACAPAKAAAEAVTRYLAVEFAPLNIRVNTASAAMLVSEVADAFPRAEEMQQVISAATPLGRLGTAAEFADVVAFLASDESRWITGQTVLADGGLTLGAPLLSPPPSVDSAAPAVDVPRVGAAVSRRADETSDTVAAAAPTEPPFDDAGSDDIAIVGMGMAVAGANSPSEFWQLRTTGAELFVPVPEERWERPPFFSSDTSAEDKSYQDTCVFITDFEPEGAALEGLGDPKDHELTTMWLRHSMVQALDGVRRGDGDRYSFLVGYTPDGSQHLEEAGVITGISQRAEKIIHDLNATDSEREQLLVMLKDTLRERYWRGGRGSSRFLPHRVGQVAMDGILPDDTELQMVDTACSSSLYAIDIGIKGLLMGKHDIAVCGGAFALAPRGTVLFSKLQGLSKRGAVHSLDAEADGVIFADGAGVIVLKRLRQAQRDGDRVLAVIKAFGSSSDGKGKAIYAPNSDGQDLAVQRALDAGVSGRDVDWIIAHATGTPAGDLAEFTTLRKHFGTQRTSYVTSNKSLIGHTGWAAGVVSVIEAILGMEHETIPHQYRFNAPNPDFQLEKSELEIPKKAVPWPAEPGRIRSAAVSGFGFGGTNAHLIVQEYQKATEQDSDREPVQLVAPSAAERVAIVAWSAHVPGVDSREEVRSWLSRGGARPQSSFGEFYPAPSFKKVRLPPKTVRAIDRCQLMILECAHDLRDQFTEFWEEHSRTTGVFVGNMGPTRAAMLYANRCYLDDIAEALRQKTKGVAPDLLDDVISRLREQVRDQIPPSNEDSFPGMMPNVISARVANYFDLRGPNITLDSGFSSALTAVETACRYLQSGELDFALAGGINGNSLPEYRTVLSDLFGPSFEDTRELAEGAFLFGLATETTARKAGLPILGFVDGLTADGAVASGTSVIECGAGTYERARYLGAAGGLALLDALHRPAGQVTVISDGGHGTTTTELHLTVTGAYAAEPPSREAETETTHRPGAPEGSLVPEKFADNEEFAPGRPLQVRRRVPVLDELPSIETRDRVAFLPPGVVVLTDLPDLGASLRHLPDDALVLSTAKVDVTRPGWLHLPEVSPETVRAALDTHGHPVRHVRVVTDLTRSAPLPRSLATGSDTLTALHDATFLTLQACFDDLDTEDSSFIALMLGALQGDVPHAFTGMFSGLVKCAFLELPKCLTFGLFTSAQRARKGALLAEQESRMARTFPIVFEDEGTRKGYRLVDEAVDLSGDHAAQLNRDSVVLAFGGARGITAEVVKSVAECFAPRIYLVGSNPLDSYPAEVFSGDDDTFAATRPTHIRRSVAAGRTVAQANREFDRMVDARAARRNIAEMEAQCGAGRVTYFACDVQDQAAVKDVVTKVLAQEKSVDLLINAAGRNRSASIRDKDFAEFTAIRDLKLRSYHNLKRAFGGTRPRIWCNFGSLLGYFGQVGEPDYATGNDFLASAATFCAKAAQEAEFTIGWTLWDGTGMGANELTKAYFQRAGSYSHMAVAEGTHHFIRELHAPNRQPSVVHIGSAEEATVERFYPGYGTGGDASVAGSGTHRPQGFYLRRMISHDDDEATFECTFDLETDAYLHHHLVRDAPTLPGTFVTEIAGEAARFLEPDKQVVAYEDLEFQHFLRAHGAGRNTPKRITARVLDRRQDLTTVEVRITTDVVSPSGVLLVKDRTHFVAKVLLREDFPAPSRWEHWDDSDAQPVPDPYHAEASPVRLTGPFVSTTDTRLTAQGKRATYRLDLPADDPVWSRFITPSILLDGLARTGVLNLVDGHLVPIAAPLSIRRIDLYERGNDKELVERYGSLELFCTPVEFNMPGDTPDNRFVAATSDGRVIAQMKDLRGTVIGYVDHRTGRFSLPNEERLDDDAGGPPTSRPNAAELVTAVR